MRLIIIILLQLIIINAQTLPAPIPIILPTVLARRPFLIIIGVNIERYKNPTLAYDRMYLNGVINQINPQAFPCNSLEIFLIIERMNIEKIYMQWENIEKNYLIILLFIC